MSGALLGGNILKNIALHTGTPFKAINRYQYDVVEKALGANLNNPKTIWWGEPFRVSYSLHEDLAGNLLHMLIGLLGIVPLAMLWRKGRYRKSTWYALGVLLGALLYCWLLRWQPWASRLHTPLFVLAAPLMAMAITRGSSWKQIGTVICSLLVLYSLPFALYNASRPLMSLDWLHNTRDRLYFVNKFPSEQIYGNYQSAAKELEGAADKDVGLFLGGDDWEYPIWVFSGCSASDCRFNFRAVGVGRDPGTIQPEEFLPLYVIATRPLEEWAHAAEYFASYRSEAISVFRKLDTGGSKAKAREP